MQRPCWALRPRGDTIRGLLWTLEHLLSPMIQPQCQHCIPFNACLTKEEALVGRAAINEAWKVSCSVLGGLDYLTTRGYVSRWGAECPAHWSPGDFCNAIDDARAALMRLEALNDKLYQLRYGKLPR